MRCPICKGIGEIAEPKRPLINESAAKRTMARALHHEGYSYREIAKLVGWKSPRSVQLALENS